MREIAPLFSVVTVCKDCKDKLLRTARSVNQQEFSDFEYIIKDGGSTDGTVDVFNDIQATKTISEPDSGIFNAMNIALDHCSGEYVIFLNAGDTFCDNYVLTTVANDIVGNAPVDFLYGNIISLKSRRKFITYPKKLSRFFLYSNSICHQAWFVKKSLYLKMGKFDDSKRIGGDHLFFLKCIAQEKVNYRHVDYFVANYEGSGASADINLVRKSEFKRQSTREAAFNPLECMLYDFVIKIRAILKKTFYDTFFYRFYELYGLYHYEKHNKLP